MPAACAHAVDGDVVIDVADALAAHEKQHGTPLVGSKFCTCKRDTQLQVCKLDCAVLTRATAWKNGEQSPLCRRGSVDVVHRTWLTWPLPGFVGWQRGVCGQRAPWHHTNSCRHWARWLPWQPNMAPPPAPLGGGAPPAFTTMLTHTHAHARIGVHAGPVIGHQRQPSPPPGPPTATNMAWYITVNPVTPLGGTVTSRA